MALSINKRRALIPPSAEDTLKDLPTLLVVETLDLSHGDIVGDKVAHYMQFLALADAPFALQSVNLSHNRLGDAGASALAQLLHANASRLPNLKALDLAHNGICDEGALTLMRAVEEAVAGGHLRQFVSVALHGNDISNAALRSVDTVWREIALTKALSWSRTELPPEVREPSGASSFVDLLAEHVERVKADRIAKIVAVLEPVSTFIKRVLWHHVTIEREMFPKHLVLRVFPALREDAVTNVPPLISGSSQVWQRRRCIGTVETYLPMSPELQRIMKMVEPARAGFYRLLLQHAVEDSDPGGFVVSMASRAEIDASTIGAVAAQLEVLYLTIADAQEVVNGFNRVSQWPGDYISTALSQALGLKSIVKAKTRTWGLRAPTTEWAIEDGRHVTVVTDPKPVILQPGGHAVTSIRSYDPETGYVIVCELPC